MRKLKIDIAEMEKRILYLTGYYTGLAKAEDGYYSGDAEVYKVVRDDFIWALGGEADAEESDT